MSPLRSGQFAFFAGLILHYIPRHRTGRNRQRTGQIHLPWAAAAGKVPVLRTDHNLVGTRRDPGPSVNTRPTTRLDDVSSGFLEDLQISAANSVVTRLLRAELYV